MIGEHVAAPDYTEPVVGFRVFELEKLPYGEWALRSPYAGTRWTKAERSAVCTDRSWERRTRLVRYDGPTFPGNPHPGLQPDPESPLITEGVWVRPHPAPAQRCRCGLYAYFHPPAKAEYDPSMELAAMRYSMLGDSLKVPALVIAWGRIEEHETGLRAQHMRVCALGVTDRTREAARFVADTLGIALCPAGQLAAQAPEYGRLLKPLPRPRGNTATSPASTVGIAEPPPRRWWQWLGTRPGGMAVNGTSALLNAGCWVLLGQGVWNAVVFGMSAAFFARAAGGRS